MLLNLVGDQETEQDHWRNLSEIVQARFQIGQMRFPPNRSLRLRRWPVDLTMA
jgi:hypothetical protein